MVVEFGCQRASYVVETLVISTASRVLSSGLANRSLLAGIRVCSVLRPREDPSRHGAFSLGMDLNASKAKPTRQIACANSMFRTISGGRPCSVVLKGWQKAA